MVDFVVVALVWVPLPSEHEGHLLLDNRVLAGFHDFIDHLDVVHLLGHSQSVAVLSLALVDLEGGAV